MSYPWQYDETIQVGTDYRDEKEVQVYDQRMQQLRDVNTEADGIRKATAISSNSLIWEIGTGTGECALLLSRHCRQVIATDASPAMLAYARRKAEQRQIVNVEFEIGGFLSGFQPAGEVDAVISQLALHHLPDFWKFRALDVIARKLRPGGRFFLRDVVFSSETRDYNALFQDTVDDLRLKGGDELAKRTIRHIKSEFSTLDWILEGMMERSGLRVMHKGIEGFLTAYVCEKQPSNKS